MYHRNYYHNTMSLPVAMEPCEPKTEDLIKQLDKDQSLVEDARTPLMNLILIKPDLIMDMGLLSECQRLVGHLCLLENDIVGTKADLMAKTEKE